jgi:hypothetical protein
VGLARLDQESSVKLLLLLLLLLLWTATFLGGLQLHFSIIILECLSGLILPQSCMPGTACIDMLQAGASVSQVNTASYMQTAAAAAATAHQLCRTITACITAPAAAAATAAAKPCCCCNHLLQACFLASCSCTTARPFLSASQA